MRQQGLRGADARGVISPASSYLEVLPQVGVLVRMGVAAYRLAQGG